MLTLLV